MHGGDGANFGGGGVDGEDEREDDGEEDCGVGAMGTVGSVLCDREILRGSLVTEKGSAHPTDYYVDGNLVSCLD